MKTIAYNPEKEIMTAITVLIISIAVLTTAKAQDNQTFVALKKYNEGLVYHKINNSNFNNSYEILEEEAPLAVEAWMNSNTFWGATQFNETAEAEPALAVENWMNSNSFWGTTSVTETIEAEPMLAVENWMDNNNYWGAPNTTEVLEYEAPLAVEYWMHCNTYWMGTKFCGANETEMAEIETPQNIESWMNNDNYWGLTNNQQLASK
jgi:hypothetical protein